MMSVTLVCIIMNFVQQNMQGTTFFNVALEEPTLTDLNWCMHDVSDVRILRYICETRKYDRMLGRDYSVHLSFLRRLPKSIPAVLSYTERHVPQLCLQSVRKQLAFFDETRPHLANLYAFHPQTMWKCSNRHRKRLRTYYMLLRKKEQDLVWRLYFNVLL